MSTKSPIEWTDFTYSTDTSEVPSLTYLPAYISSAEEAALFELIDQQPWLSDLKRRVQHYGYRYNYRARSITTDLKIGVLPDWLTLYAERLHTEGLFSTLPDQVIINEYQPGQGISAHIDCVPCFTETIASLSLGSPCVMEFSKAGDKVPVLLEPRSLMILEGDARYRWQHAIPARKTDRYEGKVWERGRRVSLTFRGVT